MNGARIGSSRVFTLQALFPLGIFRPIRIGQSHENLSKKEAEEEKTRRQTTRAPQIVNWQGTDIFALLVGMIIIIVGVIVFFVLPAAILREGGGGGGVWERNGASEGSSEGTSTNDVQSVPDPVAVGEITHGSSTNELIGVTTHKITDGKHTGYGYTRDEAERAFEIAQDNHLENYTIPGKGII
jgi:hypothetical protein